ncbi:MAG TPA: NUDIX hydrolase [Nocardioides sp.]|nr:NUDIX hydrolase [Nocardioides sp.]
MPERTDVVAAGVVVLRPGGEVLLVHRPRYDDWTLPKGKLDPGESAPVAAVREVAEETGIRVRLGAPLEPQRYVTGARWKTVHWWVGWPVGEDDVSSFQANDEVDEVAWVPRDEAVALLSYARDRTTLEQAAALRRRTVPLVVLRHAKAHPRKQWKKRSDRERPLDDVGQWQARQLVAVLAAYDVSRVVSSSSTRCVQTVAPYATNVGLEVEERDGLSQEDATDETVAAIVEALLEDARAAVLCTHRPVLPSVFDALDVRDPSLEPGGAVVFHHRKGRVVAVEVLGHP